MGGCIYGTLQSGSRWRDRQTGMQAWVSGLQGMDGCQLEVMLDRGRVSPGDIFWEGTAVYVDMEGALAAPGVLKEPPWVCPVSTGC